MAMKAQKVALLEVFHPTAKTKFSDKRDDMFHRVINSLNVDTATGVDFTKIALQNVTFDLVAVSPLFICYCE